MEKEQSIAELVRRYFTAYESGDRAVLEEILSKDFSFKSPLDEPPIGRTRYFEHCWPAHTKIKVVDFQNLLVEGDEAVVRYACTLHTGAHYRCCEYLRAKDGRITEVDVYIGNTPDYLCSIFSVDRETQHPQS